MDGFLQKLEDREKEIDRKIQLDYDIGADPYTNIGLKKQLVKIRKEYIETKGGN